MTALDDRPVQQPPTVSALLRDYRGTLRLRRLGSMTNLRKIDDGVYIAYSRYRIVRHHYRLWSVVDPKRELADGDLVYFRDLRSVQRFVVVLDRHMGGWSR